MRCVALIPYRRGGFRRRSVGSIFFHLILRSSLSADRSELGWGVESCSLISLHASPNAPAHICCMLLGMWFNSLKVAPANPKHCEPGM